MKNREGGQKSHQIFLTSKISIKEDKRIDEKQKASILAQYDSVEQSLWGTTGAN